MVEKLGKIGKLGAGLKPDKIRGAVKGFLSISTIRIRVVGIPPRADLRFASICAKLLDVHCTSCKVGCQVNCF